MSDEPSTPPVEVPWQNLSGEILEALIDDFILREGTDYGSVEASIEAKRRDVLRQLQSKRAKIYFDPESETVTMVPVAR